MNNNDENGSVEMRYMTRPMYEGNVVTEVSCDHTLPDYLPEIRRLLYITNTVLPPAKYVGGSNAELDGTIDLSVLYVGADGGLYTAPISCGYNLSVPLENASDFDLNEGVTLFATSNAENINARVSGPRRFTVRMRLRTYVRAYGKMPYSERCIGNVNEESVQRLTQKSRTADLVSALSDVIQVSDEINGVSDEVRVISFSRLLSKSICIRSASTRLGMMLALRFNCTSIPPQDSVIAILSLVKALNLAIHHKTMSTATTIVIIKPVFIFFLLLWFGVVFIPEV